MTMKKVIKVLVNKYVLVLVLFIAWLTFFDRNNLFTQLNYRADLAKLTAEKQFYVTETKKLNTELKAIVESPAYLEKAAREKYYFKRANEEIYIVVPDTTTNL